MREIKFRALAPDKKGSLKWFDDVITDGEEVWIQTKHQGTRYLKETKKLVQYTGLKDIDGIEIYEGDIVQIVEYEARYDGKFDEFRSEVIFTDGCFSYMQYEEHLGCKTNYCLSSVCTEDGVDSKGSHFCNVIGNIYEHKHLLGGE